MTPEPVDLSQVMKQLENDQSEEDERRKLITRKIESAMGELKIDTILKHRRNIVNWMKRWHDNKDHTFYILS